MNISGYSLPNKYISEIKTIQNYKEYSSSESETQTESEEEESELASASPPLSPKEQLVKTDISQLKETKEYNIKKSKELQKVVHEVKQVYKKILLEDSQPNTMREELGFEANILHFPREKDNTTKPYLLLGEKVNGTLGTGGYKEAFLGISLHSSHFVAIAIQKNNPQLKEIHEKISKEIIKEHHTGMQIQKALGPTHIQTTKLISEFKSEGEEVESSRIALVSDLCIGTYRDVQGGEIKATPKKILADFKALAKTLHKIHALGFVHRDIKEDNLFIDPNHNAKFADWGLSQHVDEMQPVEFEKACARDFENLVNTFSSIIWSKAQDQAEFEAIKNDFMKQCLKNNVIFIPYEKPGFFNNQYYTGMKSVSVKCTYQDLINQTKSIDFNEKTFFKNIENAFGALQKLHKQGKALAMVKPEDFYVTPSLKVVLPDIPRMVTKDNAGDNFQELCKQNMQDLALLIGEGMLPREREDLDQKFEQLCLKFEIDITKNESGWTAKAA